MTQHKRIRLRKSSFFIPLSLILSETVLNPHIKTHLIRLIVAVQFSVISEATASQTPDKTVCRQASQETVKTLTGQNRCYPKVELK